MLHGDFELPANECACAGLGYQTGSCGYCKAEGSTERRQDSTASYYALTSSLTVEHYQTLADRGWRRSGVLLYKPDVELACCPHYTVRLPVTRFKASRDQRQVLNRWNRHVLGEVYAKEVARLHPKSKEDKKRARNDFDLISTVHAAESSSLPAPPPKPNHEFTVTLELDNFTEEKYELYAHYQAAIHHEPEDSTSRSGFKRFLCNSTLRRKTRVITGHNGETIRQRLGSYHHCYRLDGRLIAFSVLDLLPHAVSGVYFIYHTNFSAFSFGKLSALREIALAIEDGYGYYYMGYYIHSCPKMKYKGDLKPQTILDPESFEWEDFEGYCKQLDQRPYVSFARDRRMLEAAQKPGEETVQTSRDGTEGIISLNGMDIDSIPDYHTNYELPRDKETARQDGRRPYATPLEAANAVERGTSLFHVGFPGMMTAAETVSQCNLDGMKIKLGRYGGEIHRAEELVGWDESEIEEARTVKGMLGEFAAVVGPDVARGVCLEFKR